MLPGIPQHSQSKVPHLEIKDNNCRTLLDIIRWHHHNNRLFFSTLHKFRSGHNRLNYFISRIYHDQDPICIFCCSSQEDAPHFLLYCNRFTLFPLKLIEFLIAKLFPLNIESLLGCNPTLPTDRININSESRICCCVLTDHMQTRWRCWTLKGSDFCSNLT